MYWMVPLRQDIRSMCFCALTCTPAKEVQWFPNLGLYSGIFAMFIQLSQKKSRMASIIFYALCLLYVLSTVIVVLDLVNNIIEAGEPSNNPESIRKNIFFLISCAEDIQANWWIWRSVIPSYSATHFYYPSYRKRLLWFPRPMYLSTHTKSFSCTYHPFYSSKSSKDLPLLDRVGKKYQCRDRSFTFCNHILRSVWLSQSILIW